MIAPNKCFQINKELLDIAWIVSTGEQVGEKLKIFQSLNKIAIFKDDY
jgi:hypothetical protein